MMKIIRQEFWEGIGRNVAVGRCICGGEVALQKHTNTCSHCDRLYNRAGQELRDPRHWGEETGEHPEECW